MPKKKKIKFKQFTVLFPHCREIKGQLYMLEPMLSGEVWLPNDKDTSKCLKEGWLKPTGREI